MLPSCDALAWRGERLSTQVFPWKSVGLLVWVVAQARGKVNSGNMHVNVGRITASGIKFLSLFLGVHGSSLVLDIKDFLLKTSLKERAKSLIGPFCCSVNVESKWCKHSGDPGPEQSIPKIYIDLRGGLLQVCIRWLWLCCWAGLALDDWVFINKLHESL